MASEAENDQNVLLRNLVPLNALSDECLGQLIGSIVIERANKGDYLFKEGDTDHQHIYLLAGRVNLLSGDKEVDTVQGASNTARFALAHQWPRKFSARAETGIQLARIDSRTLSELLVRTQSQSYRVSELDSESNSDWMSRVLRSRVFQQIPASNIQNVLLRMQQQDVATGEEVIRQGEPGDYYYVIVRGTANVTRTNHGKTRQIAHLGPGDSFGEDALVADGTRGGTVSMNSAGTLMRLNKDDFLELIKRPLVRGIGYQQGQERCAEGAVWLDLRSVEQFAEGHIEGAVHIPLQQLRTQSAELDPELEYLVYGDHTDVGALGAFLLRERGFNVFVLDGGSSGLAPEALGGAATQPADEPTQPAADSLPTDTPDTPPKADAEGSAGILRNRVEELETKLQDTHARFHKALYQRVAELRTLKQALDKRRVENARLQEEVERLNSASAAQAQQGLQSDERQQFNQRIKALQEELDEVQDVLQEASAEESSHQWERLRLEQRIAALESSLAEQTELNQVLREENEQTMRRLEEMRERIIELESLGKGNSR